MTASELLALLGLAWWRLLVYPSGIALLLAIWLTTRPVSQTQSSAIAQARPSVGVQSVAFIALIAPWLAIALLPLPGTRPLNRPLDAFAALALLDAPLFAAVTVSLRAGGARRLVALNGYPVLILALALLSNGALTFDGLAQPPASDDLRATAMHWFGAVTLLLALPALLNLGPLRLQPTVDHTPPNLFSTMIDIGLWLRALGLTLITALPWIAWFGEQWWFTPLPPLLIALLLWAFHRSVRFGAIRWWGWGYISLMVVQLVVLLARDVRVSQ